jgi:8-oxo-dGTP diphosphatase
MNTFTIRTATKAIIIEEDRILLNHYQKDQKEWYTLPGGGQDHNEDHRSNLQRECLEEMGASVEVQDILFVREYIADHHNPPANRKGYHQVNVIFEAHLTSQDFTAPHHQDPHQAGVHWIHLEDLHTVNLYPHSIRADIQAYHRGEKDKVYLGETD